MRCRPALVSAVAVLLAHASTVAAFGPAGPEMRVNAYTTNAQSSPAVGADGTGNFFVVWSSYGQDGSSSGIFGQRFFSNGLRSGSELQINISTASDQFHPGAAGDGAGNFVVVWASDGQDGDNSGVVGRRFDAVGNPIGTEFQVNTYTTGFQGEPVVAASNGGSFVVVWESYLQDGAQLGIFGQRFNSSGARIGGEFQVNTYTTNVQDLPAIFMNNDTSFVVVWSSQGQGGSGSPVIGQRFDTAGAKVGTEFQINTSTAAQIGGPSAAADAAGNFVVTWETFDGSYSHISGRRFDPTGNPLTAEFPVNIYTPGNQSSPRLAMESDGHFAITWESQSEDGSGAGIFGRRFDPSATPIGVEFQVNTYITGDQSAPAAIVNGSGNFVVVWQSDGQDGSGSGIFAQPFAEVTPTSTPTPLTTPTPTATSSPTPTPLPTAITLERNTLHFGVVKSGSTLLSVSPAQTVGLTAPGSWTVDHSLPFINASPTFGSGTGTLSIDVESSLGLPASGPAQATVTVNDALHPTNPQVITTFVQVYAPGTTTPPFGSFDTPLDNATGVTGAIGVTGWALDDIGIARVELWRDRVSGDPPPAANGKIFIGNATFVSGARPDVEALYSTDPASYHAAWGYMLLTNLLPDLVAGTPAGGRGTYTLYAYVYDVEGNLTILPSRTFTCDNTTATKPFGTIDTPTQGQTVSGTINNFGWVLTPQPGVMPTDGHTIVLFIDGVPHGTATYNAARSDLATLFPGYNNTAGPVGLFTIDTTTLTNGVHTMAWSATDNLARADGIGSRYFTVLN